ncbi:VOC family protein [Agromyces aerolatus]|uniref:VOC family protein n=1 Tax=Agromyces sp. LY-1074 TaxID=3074080 RepID=UPI0028567355|nr:MULTISPECIES: VOC family protein [unclassified Agromyces]MDR5699115.1 VOC family protein [Agromyces sp. LY-1074]MDR5705106.1 VOC family protein [Agromyces sp. LY-1358]
MVDSRIVQLGFVVTDLRAAAMEWTRRFGIGPWFYWEHLGDRAYRFRGEASAPDLSTAMADWNGIQIQLVEQHDDAPSPHRDWLASHGGAPGLNHLAVAVPDFEAEVARRSEAGETPLSEAGQPVNNVFYHWGDWNLPAIELSERRPPSIVPRLYELVAEAARDWDGSEPWRPMPELD